MRRDLKMLDTNTLRKVTVKEQERLSGRGEVTFRELFGHLSAPRTSARDGGVDEDLPEERAPDYREQPRRSARLASQM